MENRTNRPLTSSTTGPINGLLNGPVKKSHTIRHFQPLFMLFALSLISCSSWLPDAHRIDVTQGNTIKPKVLDKIHTGMKKSDITPILGTPLISDPFHNQRWDYIYRYLPGHGELVQSRVTLFFENEVLVRIDDSEYRKPVADIKENEEIQANTPAAHPH